MKFIWRNGEIVGNNKKNINMNSKIILTAFLLSCLFPVIVKAQETTDPQCYVYLWDVTLSMRGPKHGGIEDIWESTKTWLIDEIEAKEISPNDTIVVCPFQECIISGKEGRKRIGNKVVPRPFVTFDTKQPISYDSPWKYPVTKNGKRELINKIKTFIQPYHGLTNLYGPLKEVKRNYVDTLKYTTTIYMLTDGRDDFNTDPDSSFIREVNEKWSPKDPLLIYIRLTKSAVNIKPRPGTPVDTISPPNRYMEVSITSSGSYNFKNAAERNKYTQTFNVTQIQKNYKLPQGIKVRVFSDNNPFVKIDDVCEVVDGKIEVKLNYDQDAVDANIFKDCLLDMNFEIVTKALNCEDGYTYQITKSNKSCKSLRLVNEIQRTLKIKLREAEVL